MVEDAARQGTEAGRAGATLVLFGILLLMMSRFIRRLGVQLRER